MTQQLFRRLLAASMFLTVPAAAAESTYPVNVAQQQSTGAKVRGPVTIVLRGVNVLRNQVSVGDTVTFTPQNLALPFIPPLPAAPKPIAGGPPALPPVAAAKPPAAPADLNADMLAHLNRIDDARQRWANLQAEMAAVVVQSNAAKSAVEAFVASSDAALQGGATDASIQASIIAPITPLLAQLQAVLDTAWPDGTGIVTTLSNIRTGIQGLPLKYPSEWTAWYGVAANKALYDTALAETSTLSATVSAAGPASATALAILTAQQKHTEWRSILSAVAGAGPSAFTIRHSVGCNFTFGGTKETRVDLISSDRLAAAGTTAVRREIVTVVCTSPISVSGGVTFSSLDEGTFALQTAPKTVTTTTSGVTTTTTSLINRIGYSARSSYRPHPVALVNVRLWEPNEAFSFHFSNGAAVDLGTGNVGSDVEYITGLGISFHRTIFLTGGWHLGRSQKLVNFNVGDEAPTGLTALPLEKQWKNGIHFSITYRIR